MSEVPLYQKHRVTCVHTGLWQVGGEPHNLRNVRGGEGIID